mgnify:CR=1 FL=1
MRNTNQEGEHGTMRLTNTIKYTIKHNGFDKITNKYRCKKYMLSAYGVVFKNSAKIDNEISKIIQNNYIIDNYEYTGKEMEKMSEQFNINEYKRLRRCKARVEQLVNMGECLFLTFTFNNDYYKDTNQDTRRRYAYRTLKKLNCPFIANQDFGKLNGRHHIHALVNTDKVAPTIWKYGNIDFERVSKDPQKVGEYIGKLTEHTLKETTKNNRIMYSRLVAWNE